MKNFLLGVGATLAALVLVLVGLVFSLGSDAPSGAGSTASPRPTGSVPVAQQPTDLKDDETWLGAVDLRSQDVISAKGDLVDVVATGSGVRFSQAGLKAQRLDIDATIPFATVAKQVGADVTVYDAGNGKTGVERTVTILGRDLTLKATGTVTADGGAAAHRARDHRPRRPVVPRLRRELAGPRARHHPAGRPRRADRDVPRRGAGDPSGVRRPAQRHRRGHRPLNRASPAHGVSGSGRPP